MEHALKSRDCRRLAADRYECKTSTQFFKIEYGQPFQLIGEKIQKTNQLFYELRHMSVMTIAYPQKAV